MMDVKVSKDKPIIRWVDREKLIYTVVQKKHPILFFIPKLCFAIFFHIVQAAQTAGLEDSFGYNLMLYCAVADKNY